LTTTGEWFAAVFIGGAAIAGVVFFIIADGCPECTEERFQMNLWGLLSWALALAMGALKF